MAFDAATAPRVDACAFHSHFQLRTRRGNGATPRKVAIRDSTAFGAAANSSRVRTSSWRAANELSQCLICGAYL